MSDSRQAIILETLEHARRSGGEWLRACCPFCVARTGKPDRKGAWGFNQRSGIYQCFKCGIRGRLSGPEYEGKLAARKEERVELEMPSSFFPLVEDPAATAASSAAAREYLVKRGIGPRLWARAQIGVALSGRHYGRVIVPILDDEGREWLGWVGRAWVKRADLPYLYPHGMERGTLIYNQEALLVQTDEPAVACEGVFDTFPSWPNGVALLGKPSGPQLDAMAEAPRPIAVVLDGDAWMEGWALAAQLRLMGQRAGAVRLPPGKDPDEVDADWLKEECRRCVL